MTQMKFRVVTIAALAAMTTGFFYFAPSRLEAQQKKEPTPQQGSDSSPIVAKVTRVSMLFSVTDKKGRFVTDLDKNDFKVYDNKKPQKILEFTSPSNLPLRLAILIDTSSSIRNRFQFQQEAATNFVNDVMRDQDKALVVSFDTAAELAADLTNNTNTLEDAIRDLKPGGGTALFDAIYFACRDKLMQDQPLYDYRRAMILLSDGQDDNSRYSKQQALEMAQRANTVIYAITTNTTHLDTEGDETLRYLAEKTGGKYYAPFQASDLNQSFQNIANELRHQYNLLYRPNPLVTDGRFHPVSIKIVGKARKDLVVHVRTGYFAAKETS